jgi:hypothetical protein
LTLVRYKPVAFDSFFTDMEVAFNLCLRSTHFDFFQRSSARFATDFHTQTAGATSAGPMRPTDLLIGRSCVTLSSRLGNKNSPAEPSSQSFSFLGELFTLQESATTLHVHRPSQPHDPSLPPTRRVSRPGPPQLESRLKRQLLTYGAFAWSRECSPCPLLRGTRLLTGTIRRI